MRTIDLLRREFPGGWEYDASESAWLTPLIAFVRYRVTNVGPSERPVFRVERIEERDGDVVHWMQIAITGFAERAGYWVRVDFDRHLEEELRHHTPTPKELEIMDKLREMHGGQEA